MKEVISTKNAPAAIGPYSQAIKVGGMLYMSGQIALIPETGEVVDEGVEAQTIRVLQNMEGVLTEAGLTFADIVKTTVFLTDLEDFSAVNSIYGEKFPINPPAPPFWRSSPDRHVACGRRRAWWRWERSVSP